MDENEKINMRGELSAAYASILKELEKEKEREEQVASLEQERKQALDGVEKIKTLLAELEEKLTN